MGALMARLNMARPQPVQPISVHVSFYVSFYVSLALSPLGSSCVSMCGPWCILAHSDAFVCINVHSCAFLRIMKRVDRAPALIQIVRKSGLFPPKWTEIHKNAHKCITGRMQHIQNAPSWECVGMCWNALRCGMYRMQHTKNAHECILCNECTRMQQAKKCNQNRMHSNAHECTLYQMQHWKCVWR